MVKSIFFNLNMLIWLKIAYILTYLLGLPYIMKRQQTLHSNPSHRKSQHCFILVYFPTHALLNGCKIAKYGLKLYPIKPHYFLTLHWLYQDNLVNHTGNLTASHQKIVSYISFNSNWYLNTYHTAWERAL